jgi:hypothetical protein
MERSQLEHFGCLISKASALGTLLFKAALPPADLALLFDSSRFYTLLWHLSVAAVRGALVKKYPSAAPPQKRLIDAGTYKLAGVIAKAPKVSRH